MTGTVNGELLSKIYEDEDKEIISITLTFIEKKAVKPSKGWSLKRFIRRLGGKK